MRNKKIDKGKNALNSRDAFETVIYNYFSLISFKK